MIPAYSEFGSSILGKVFDGLVLVIDAIATLVGWFIKSYEWAYKVGLALQQVKVPDWLRWIMNSGTAVFSAIGGAVSRTSPENRAAFAASSSSTSPRAGGAARIAGASFQASTAVYVSIDGQQLQGRITRSIQAAQQYEGARYMAGGWA